MKVLTSWVTAWLLCLAPVCGHAQAADQETTEAQVEELLRSGVDTAVPASHFAALGEPGERALRSIFERTSAPKYVRLRALGALSALESERALNYLVRLLDSADIALMERLGSLHPVRSATVLRRTLRGLEGRMGRVQAESVLPYLAHRDASIRAQSVRLLAKKPGPEVTRALLNQRAQEPSREVLSALTRALRDRPAPPAGPPRAVPGNDLPPR